MEFFAKMLGAIMVFGGMLMLWAMIIGLPTMWLWNYVCPSMFGLHEIEFWKAVALVLLCGILFGGSKVSSSSK